MNNCATYYAGECEDLNTGCFVQTYIHIQTERQDSQDSFSSTPSHLHNSISCSHRELSLQRVIFSVSLRFKFRLHNETKRLIARLCMKFYPPSVWYLNYFRNFTFQHMFFLFYYFKYCIRMDLLVLN